MSPNKRHAWTRVAPYQGVGGLRILKTTQDSDCFLPQVAGGENPHSPPPLPRHWRLPKGCSQGKPASPMLETAAGVLTESAPSLNKPAPATSALGTRCEAHTHPQISSLQLTPCSPHRVKVLVRGWEIPMPMPHHIHSTQRSHFSRLPRREKNSEEREGVSL